jgi:hypothetical protein
MTSREETIGSSSPALRSKEPASVVRPKANSDADETLWWNGPTREERMPDQSPRVTATIIWAGLVAGPTIFLGVTLYLVFGLRGGAGLGTRLSEPALIGGSLALSVVSVALSWLWAVRMPIRAPGSVAPRGRGAIPPGPEADAVARLIIACALCEGGALAAVVVVPADREPARARAVCALLARPRGALPRRPPLGPAHRGSCRVGALVVQQVRA